MIHRSLAMLVCCMLIFMTFTAVAIAGTEPSPFKPEINKLNAVTNNLSSIHNRINKVLGSPPDDQSPSPNVNGAVGRLSAMDHQLVLLDGMVESIKNEVLGTPPD
ncbi:MAG: hypothetical protein KJO26_05925, partial [Deltaproteobacteria bacterium]|nr:hypothetical protein [Deltaproteobacteria bacterium]